jgi:hypothetical protein
VSWIRVAGLGSVTPARRTELLAAAMSELILCQLAIMTRGPFAAALAYAARGGRVRIDAQGEIIIWAGPP